MGERQCLAPRSVASDWRRLFGQGDFPFYIVSLRYYKAHKDVPSEDSWAEVREAQALTAKKVPNSRLAVTVDTDNAADVHPTRKNRARSTGLGMTTLCKLQCRYRIAGF